MAIVLLLLLLLIAPIPIPARLHHALAEDIYAFPKYRVSFLNGFPVRNDTAERWLKDGLPGGQLEFLEQPWQASQAPPPRTFKSIGSGDGQVDTTPVEDVHAVRVQLMRTSPAHSYLCLIPPPIETGAAKIDEDLRADPTPTQSWSQLQALSGSCLYHRHGWFTYSYCHNHQVRQFREMAHSHPHPPGGYVPEEDPAWEAFTLGRSPPLPTDGRELTLAQQNVLAKSVELARGAGHRYLVQKWSDGTFCDKTGKPREIEVQFHCSMTMTDTILFVKETTTCKYVMVIHTPRLCGEPGFKTRLEQRDEAYIRCREVLDSTEHADRSLPDAPHPIRRRQRNPILGSPPAPQPAELKEDDAGADAAALKDPNELIRRAVEKMMGGSAADGSRVKVEHGKEPGELLIEFFDDDIDMEEVRGQVDNLVAGAQGRLEEALRAAGVDIKGRREREKKAQHDRKDNKAKRKYEDDQNYIIQHGEL